MARKAVVAIFLSILCGAALADESEIVAIRAEYQKTQGALPHLKVETVELDDYSLEGADAAAYRDKAGNIRLIKARLFHESGKEYMSFYYKDGKLIFALYVTHRYNQNVNVTPEDAKETGLEPFDPKKTLVSKDRYYFYNAKLIRWIDENKKEVSPDSKDFRDKEAAVLETASDFLSKFVKPGVASPRTP
jgi:hypothetical protein